jgi:hypothetical protein
MMINKSTYIYILTKPIVINHINKRSMATLVFLSSQIQPTYLTRLQAICFSKRSMWKAISKMIGSSPKLLKTLETKVPETSVALAKKVALTVENSLLPVPLQYSPKPFQYPLVYNQPYLSGVACLYDHERNKLTDDLIYREKYCKVLTLQLVQSLIYGFKDGKLTAKTAFIEMPNIFGFAKAATPWVKDPVIQTILQQKLFSMKQHVNALIFQDKSFAIKELSPLLENTIDFMYYKNITVAGIGEVYVAMKTLNKILSNKDFVGHVKAVDHQSPYLDEADIYKPIQCQEQISQTYSDFFITYYTIIGDNIKVDNIYRDVKMDYRGPLTGHLVLRALLTSNVKVFRDYCNDITTQLKAACSRRPLAKDLEKILEDNFTGITELRKIAKEENLLKCFDKLTTLLSDLALNPILIANHIHISLVSDMNIIDDILLREIVDNIEKDTSLNMILDDKVLFPNKSKISDIPWVKIHKIILQIIERYVPVSVRDTVRTNYTEHFLEFCTRHAIDYH